MKGQWQLLVNSVINYYEIIGVSKDIFMQSISQRCVFLIHECFVFGYLAYTILTRHPATKPST